MHVLMHELGREYRFCHTNRVCRSQSVGGLRRQRRLYTLESGKTIIGSCHWLWHTEEDIAQFKKLKGEKL